MNWRIRGDNQELALKRIGPRKGLLRNDACSGFEWQFLLWYIEFSWRRTSITIT